MNAFLFRTLALVTRSPRVYAVAALHGQVHRDGKPAIKHALRVAEQFRHDPTLYAIAVLHDVCEDTKVTVEMIERRFGKRVAAGVAALTRGKVESYDAYIRRVAFNPDAVRIKVADIYDNVARADEKCLKKLPLYEQALDCLTPLLS